MAKIKKYQAGGRPKRDSVESEMFPGKKIPIGKSNYENGNFDKMLSPLKPSPKKAAVKKAAVPKKKMMGGGKLSTAKGGKEMIKRADGSYSQRGLWDNIRANKGSGKKPTAAMLKQEKKIKAKGK
jgi:hypothetical protein